MAIRKSQVALHVRVKLNDKFEIKSLSDKYLKEDKVIFIKQEHTYNDTKGEYVFVGSVFNSGVAYLDELDLEFPISDIGLHTKSKLELKIEELENDIKRLSKILGKSASDKTLNEDNNLSFSEELAMMNEVNDKAKLLKELLTLV